jgi:hypothetical protein
MGKRPIHEVLLTTELLEAILLSLSPQDLLVNAQRVSHIWKRVIASSILLQQRLFFQSSIRKLPVLNPLLEKAFPSWFRKLAEYETLRGPKLIADIRQGQGPDTRRAITRFNASWRRMLPCHPPKTILKWRGKSEVRFEILGEKNFLDGVRMGILYDIGIDACLDPLGSFWFKWDMPGDIALSKYRIAGEKLNFEQRLRVFTSRRELGRAIVHDCPEIKEEFRSEAYEAPWSTVGEERRARPGDYGRQSTGGWLLQ